MRLRCAAMLTWVTSACVADVDGWAVVTDIETDVRGRLEVQVTDYEDERFELAYFIRDEQTGDRVLLETDQDLGELAQRAGTSQMTATGWLEDGVLRDAHAAVAADQPLAAATALSSIGDQRTVVFLVNYRNDTREPISVEQARTLVFGQISNFFREGSYGQTWLSGDVIGWVTVDQDAGCTNCGGDGPLQIAIGATGVDLAAYSRIVLIRPALSPYKGGIAGVSGCVLSGPGRTCADNYSLNASVIAHEIGHNFGLPHAGYLQCGQASLGICLDVEYGDVFDTMGSGKSYLAHFNAALKQKIGWLDTAATPSVLSVSAAGTYTIGAIETAAGTLPRALRVRKDVDPATNTPVDYFLELRTPTGSDAFLASSPFTNQPLVLLRLYSQQAWNSKVIQTRPLIADPIDGSQQNGGRQNAPELRVGEPYVDRDAGLVFEVLAADTTQATIRVSYGQPPSVVASTSAPTTAPGSTVALSATVSSPEAAIAQVEFRLGATTVCTVNAAPYTCMWTVPATANTLYDLQVVATDTRGMRGTDRLRVSTDTTPPTFTSTSAPVDGAIVMPGTSVSITAGATDNVALSHRDFFVNGMRICHATYMNCNWLVPAGLTDATFTIDVIARDTSGNTATRTWTFRTGNGGNATFILPATTITAPTADTVYPAYARSGLYPTAHVAATTTSSVRFIVDDLVLGSGTTDANGNARVGGLFQPLFVALPPGRGVTLTAFATDASRLAGPRATPVDVTIAMPAPARDLIAPSVRFTAPTDGGQIARGSTSTMTAEASDNVGVTRVEFSVNGNLACTDTTAPYSCAWKVPRGKSRSFTLQARAYDGAGNTSSTQIAVTSK